MSMGRIRVNKNCRLSGKHNGNAMKLDFNRFTTSADQVTSQPYRLINHGARDEMKWNVHILITAQNIQNEY